MIFEQYPVLNQVYHVTLLFVFGILAIMFLLCLLRIILGPDIPDRLLGANVLGGISIAAIVILSLILNESYLLDVALVYALISFLAVCILTKIYIGVRIDKKEQKKHQHDKKTGGDGK